MKALIIALILLASCSGDCSGAVNPNPTDYPCGTRAHPCSLNPVMCCGNTEQCGMKGTSCPEGMCCYIGDDFYGLSANSPQFPAAR